jgi:tetrahydromethanopterin S-methyltransferase subunit A
MSDEPAPAWPPLVGDVVFGSPESPVAVCTLASRSLLPSLAGRPEIAIAGRVYTENVGVERMIQNVVANPRLRVLLLCGRESFHRVGQTILSLHENGLDAERRVIGAGSPEPFLPNLRDDELRAFRERVRIVDLIGELDAERILERAGAFADDGTGQTDDARGRTTAAAAAVLPAEIERIQATPDARADWRYDPTGFFLIFVERASRTLRVEHYSRGRQLLRIVEGRNAEELCHTLLRRGLVTELAHAAYLGRELARAEDALHLGLHYEQDSALRRSGT